MQMSWQRGFLKMQAVVLLACGRTPSAARKFEQLLRLWPADRYSLASHAHARAQLNHFEAAIASLTQLTGAWPQDASAWFNLAYVLQRAGRHDEAEPAFRKALALDTRMDRAWYGLALSLMKHERFAEAAQALKKNTELQPMSPHGWYRLAEVWLALGQPGRARQVLGHLRQFEPRVAAQLERSMFTARPGPGRTDGPYPGLAAKACDATR